jgi:hypothetical protein
MARRSRSRKRISPVAAVAFVALRRAFQVRTGGIGFRV